MVGEIKREWEERYRESGRRDKERVVGEIKRLW